MAVVGTNHTSFTVSDLDRSIALFRDVVGLDVISHESRDPVLMAHVTGVEGAEVMVCYLGGHGHTVELIEYQAPLDREHIRPRPCDVGFAHVAYDVDDLDQTLEVAAEHDLIPINPPSSVDKGPNRGFRVAYLRDPDGVTIEFIEKPSS